MKTGILSQQPKTFPSIFEVQNWGLPFVKTFGTMRTFGGNADIAAILPWSL